ncbi:MAG: transglycosylase domain-containing protein [Bacteroidales bacterium]|nr:transglycosylase domain-containing protein [Bacteroidales bacterium]
MNLSTIKQTIFDAYNSVRTYLHNHLSDKTRRIIRIVYFPSNNKNIKKRIAINIAKVACHCIALLLLLILAVYVGVFGHLPSNEQLRNISNNNASEIYSADGKLLGRFYLQNRLSVDSADISRSVFDALIATEDSRFYEHEGIDYKSVGRVIFRTVLMLDRDQGGGSTISQQLAKNLFPRRNFGPLSIPVAKIKEVIIANRIEHVYSKTEILVLYLNTVSFGENIYGIEAASQRFFQRKAKWLKPHEAALLVGMLAANTAYNPRINPESALARRNVVLQRMYTTGKIDSTAYTKYIEEPIKLKYNANDRNQESAAFFRDAVGQTARTILNEIYGTDKYNIYTDGLRIYTTLDSRLQQYAEIAVKKHLTAVQQKFDEQWKGKEPWGKSSIYANAYKQSERYKKMKSAGCTDAEIDTAMNRAVEMLIYDAEGAHTEMMTPADSVRKAVTIVNAGFLALNPQNGYVLAYVGGINHTLSQIDHVGMRRQVGSTFKPIVYATALEHGMSPTTYVKNERRTYAKGWSPANSSHDGYGGYYSFKGALAKSLNTVSAWIINEVGPDLVVNTAHRMGIESEIPEVPSIALGTAEISLAEMVTAYQAFANGGKIHERTMITKIVDADGKVLYESQGDIDGNEVLTQSTAIYVNDMMSAVVDSGTARSLRTLYKIEGPLVGKTGTTQKCADGWFIGATPQVVAGAWVGCDNPSIHFRNGYFGQGAYMALPIVGRFMVAGKNQLCGGEFPQPLDDEMLVNMHYPLYSETEPDMEELYHRACAEVYGYYDDDWTNTPEEQTNPVRNIFHSIFGGIFD